MVACCSGDQDPGQASLAASGATPALERGWPVLRVSLGCLVRAEKLLNEKRICITISPVSLGSWVALQSPKTNALPPRLGSVSLKPTGSCWPASLNWSGPIARRGESRERSALASYSGGYSIARGEPGAYSPF